MTESKTEECSEGACKHAPPDMSEWVDAPERVPFAHLSNKLEVLLPSRMIKFLHTYAEKKQCGVDELVYEWLQERIEEEWHLLQESKSAAMGEYDRAVFAYIGCPFGVPSEHRLSECSPRELICAMARALNHGSSESIEAVVMGLLYLADARAFGLEDWPQISEVWLDSPDHIVFRKLGFLCDKLCSKDVWVEMLPDKTIDLLHSWSDQIKAIVFRWNRSYEDIPVGRMSEGQFQALRRGHRKSDSLSARISKKWSVYGGPSIRRSLIQEVLRHRRSESIPSP